MGDQGSSWLKVCTKGNASPVGKPRIYFTCHPDDMEKHMDHIFEQVFSVNDGAIYFTEDMRAPYTNENWELDLGQMNLFIIPITLKLLYGNNRALDVDLPFAKERHIPVLPLMMEEGLIEPYKVKFGMIQYLEPYSKDDSAIPYSDKLKSYLDGALLGSEIRKRVQEAFDAYIFLSYRKKDRKHANELMHLIHRNPKFRDIAIWYDEFLTPGESFDKNIEDALNKSNLFALMVTPNLLEDPNYVMTTEYPRALGQKKKILPIEMLDTEYDKMLEKYKQLPLFIEGHDDRSRDESMMRELEGFALGANDEDPEHNFLIGLAYLEGIDVEKDTDKAEKLITMAAEADLPEAMEKLAVMYRDGVGVQLDWEKEVFWRERFLTTAFRENDYSHYEKSELNQLSDAVLALVNSYSRMGRYGDVVLLFVDKWFDEKKMLWDYGLYRRIMEEDGGQDPHFLAMEREKLTAFYKQSGRSEFASALKENYEEQKELLGESHPDTLRTLSALADVWRRNGQYEDALGTFEEIYEKTKNQFGEDHLETLQCLHEVAKTNADSGREEYALDLFEHIYEKKKNVCGELHPSTLKTLSEVAYLRGKLRGEHEQALDLYDYIFVNQKKLLGKTHPDTLNNLKRYAASSKALGNQEDAMGAILMVYENSRTALGEEHPDTLKALRECIAMVNDYDPNFVAHLLDESHCKKTVDDLLNYLDD